MLYSSTRVSLAASTVDLVVLPFDPLLIDVVRFPNDDGEFVPVFVGNSKFNVARMFGPCIDLCDRDNERVGEASIVRHIVARDHQ